MFQGDEQSQIDLRLFRVWVKASKTVFDDVVKDIERSGISNENFMVLELLYNKGPHTVQNISEKFSIPSGSITYVVDKLEKERISKARTKSNRPSIFKCSHNGSRSKFI